jgi:hypothetical protein
MKFTEALKALEENRPVRRSSGRYQWIRRIDPRLEPDIDGESRVFVVMGSDGRYMSNLGEFAEESEAKAALKQLRTQLTKDHKVYADLQTIYNAADGKQREKEKLQPGISPVFRANYYEGACVESRTASRTHRLNKPYLIGMTRDNSIEPVSLTGSDLFAPDWDIA